MAGNERVKVASFDFTSCEGCQLSKINLEDEIVPLVTNYVEFVTFREAMDPISDDYEIAFVEGSISTPAGVKRVRKVRRQAKYLVAMGHCATHGGPQAMRNAYDLNKAKRESYQQFDAMPQLDSLPWSLPVSKVVKVDFGIPGCPMDKNEIVRRLILPLVMGKIPKLPDYPVCVECKHKENECVYDLGYSCMGPITLAGCDACCPSSNSPCIGCRGVIHNVNDKAQKDVLEKAGFTPEEIMNKFTWFYSYRELEEKNEEIQAVLAQIPEN
jgi:coenzyme F420-reducing hydrogenase gamma subunit